MIHILGLTIIRHSVFVRETMRSYDIGVQSGRDSALDEMSDEGDRRARLVAINARQELEAAKLHSEPRTRAALEVMRSEKNEGKRSMVRETLDKLTSMEEMHDTLVRQRDDNAEIGAQALRALDLACEDLARDTGVDPLPLRSYYLNEVRRREALTDDTGSGAS